MHKHVLGKRDLSVNLLLAALENEISLAYSVITEIVSFTSTGQLTVVARLPSGT